MHNGEKFHAGLKYARRGEKEAKLSKFGGKILFLGIQVLIKIALLQVISSV